jgi:hypothetical protein
MPKCEHCHAELEAVSFQINGRIVWNCPNDCAIQQIIDEIADKLPSTSLNEGDSIRDALLAMQDAETQVGTTPCWTYDKDGGKCPGEVRRTEETRDKPYGNFCPECGHSLRYHPQYGEGKPKDLAKRWSR